MPTYNQPLTATLSFRDARGVGLTIAAPFAEMSGLIERGLPEDVTLTDITPFGKPPTTAQANLTFTNNGVTVGEEARVPFDDVRRVISEQRELGYVVLGVDVVCEDPQFHFYVTYEGVDDPLRVQSPSFNLAQQLRLYYQDSKSVTPVVWERYEE